MEEGRDGGREVGREGGRDDCYTYSNSWAHSRPRKSLANLAKSPNFL